MGKAWEQSGAQPAEFSFLARLAAETSISNGYNLLTLSDVVHNKGNCWNNSRFTAPIKGLYHFSGVIEIIGGAQNTGSGGISFRVNGAPQLENYMNRNPYFTVHSLSTLFQLNANDYLDMCALLDSAAGSPSAQAAYRTYLSGHLVRAL